MNFLIDIDLTKQSNRLLTEYYKDS
jgi:hypothetical protein